jgi:hypothetical protein
VSYERDPRGARWADAWDEPDALEPWQPRIAPGKRTLTSQLAPAVGERSPSPAAGPVQAKGQLPGDANAVQDLAGAGFRGAPGSLPYLDRIQRSFGAYDVSSVRAYAGAPAAAASKALGAKAYASGDQIAFGSTPDLHTAAHEAAHVVQQRAGVSLRGGMGQAGDAHEVHADRVADLVVRGQSAEHLLSTMAGGDGGALAVQLLAEDGEAGIGGDDIRVAILNIALAAGGLAGPIATINATGMAVTAACVGLRGNFMARAGVGGGAGIDNMFFVDVANWQLSGDVVPFVELGIGVEAGAGFGVVVGVRISPHGEYGQANESYAGPAINASVAALAGLGFSVSPGIALGQEGWATTTISLGEQFGASLSVSYAVSGQEVVGALRGLSARLTSGLQSVIQGAAAAGRAVSQAVQGMFEQVFGVFFPDRWNLSGYTDDEAASIRRFGHYMNEVIAAQGGIDTFLQTESTERPSISARIQNHSHWDLLTMIAVTHAFNNKYRRMTGSTAEDDTIWEPTYFNETAYLDFLRFAMDNQLIG